MIDFTDSPFLISALLEETASINFICYDALHIRSRICTFIVAANGFYSAVVYPSGINKVKDSVGFFSSLFFIQINSFSCMHCVESSYYQKNRITVQSHNGSQKSVSNTRRFSFLC